MPYLDQIEVIDLDSPVKRPSTNNAANRNLSRSARDAVRGLDHSSGDESLPDLPFCHRTAKFVATNARSSVFRSKSAPGLTKKVLVEDDIVCSSPAVSKKSKSLSQAKAPAVIDLSSREASEGETEAEHQPRILKVNPADRMLTHTIHKYSSITLPITQQDTTKIGQSASEILKTLDTLLAESHSKKKRKRQSIDQVKTTAQKETNKASSGLSTSSEDREAVKARKQAEKDIKKEQKRIEKELKIAEKRKLQGIAAVNVLKKSKKDSTPEMIVRVCASFTGSALDTHLSNFMEALGCSISSCTMPVTGSITFCRRQAAEFDTDKGYWVPLSQERIIDEDSHLLVLKASEFLKVVQKEDGLPMQIASIRRARPITTKIFYLIEGLTALIRKSATQKNRAYQAAVRAAGISSGDSSVVSRPRIAGDKIVDEDAIEDALLDLQLIHNCFIVHTTSPADTAEQISILTSDLSTVPYRSERSSRSTQFCTETGQIKTGTDTRDTFEKMLQSITRVTPQIAQAIASRYTGIRELSRAIQQGPRELENIRKEQNVDGRVTGGVLGAATARNVFKALVPSDPYLEV